ncbi:hypothetical protein ACH4FX_37575 [Streptomyces sp. NPDC018019]|uniref:hypothetical protein n=1 Tax=Streptomyces sp. NPDC018019 TaxID=3365030 RepID=UPI003796A473
MNTTTAAIGGQKEGIIMEITRRTATTACLPVPAQRPPADAVPDRTAAPLATEDLSKVVEILEAAALLMIELADRYQVENFQASLFQRLGAAQVTEGRTEPASLPLLPEELALLTSAVQRIRAYAQSRSDLRPLAEEGRRVLRYLNVGLGRGRSARALRGLPVWADDVRTPR